MHCPTILTRQGDRIRSNGKFGGNQNRAPSLDKLKGVVFGAPIPDAYSRCSTQIGSFQRIRSRNHNCLRLYNWLSNTTLLTDMLNELKSILVEVESAEEELDAMKEATDTDEMRKKEEEMRETKDRLKEIEKLIGSFYSLFQI